MMEGAGFTVVDWLVTFSGSWYTAYGRTKAWRFYFECPICPEPVDNNRLTGDSDSAKRLCKSRQ